MRLLQREADGHFSLAEFVGRSIPQYAILSHTWGPDNEEVTFKDLRKGVGKSKVGYQKLVFCSKQAASDGLDFFWVDTCCIDKSSSAELQEAINSMYKWYYKATKCYVYLSDVATASLSQMDQSFEKSRWFTRGWTLQELLAPTSVAFFSREGDRLGDRDSLMPQITKVTGIPHKALQLHGSPLSQFSVEARMSWLGERETKREEDAAYCLLGLFDVHMPLLYGEGREKAFNRLREEINKTPQHLSLTLPSRGLSKEPSTRLHGIFSAMAPRNIHQLNYGDELESHLTVDEPRVRYSVYGPARSGGHGDEHADRDIVNHFGKPERHRLLRWLSTTQHRAHHQTMIKDLLPHSGAWLFKLAKYRNWETSPNSAILWLHGIPGSGKSKLTSAVAERLMGNVAQHNADFNIHGQEISLAYFYCEKNTAEAERGNPDYILACILKQLAISSVNEKPIHPAVMKEWRKRCDETDETGLEPARLHVNECENLILAILRDRTVFIVLDGLDECDPERRHEILLVVDRLIQKASKSIKFFVSSRDDGDIICHLETSPNVIIQAKDNLFDIERFVLDRIDRAIEEKRILKGNVSSELRWHIIKTIVEKSQGMFRWVSLKIQALCDFRSVKHEEDVREELGFLPTSLSELYDRTYDQIMCTSVTGRNVAVQALRWLLYSPRTISTDELISAVLLSSREKRWIHLNIQDVLNMCCNLLTHDEELDTFRFTHLTVREYLENKPEYAEADIHNMALDVCLDTYAAATLNWNSVYGLSVPRQKFLNYAIDCLFSHYKALYEQDPALVRLSSRKVKSILEKAWEVPVVDELKLEYPSYSPLLTRSDAITQMAAIKMRSVHMPPSPKTHRRVPCVWVDMGSGTFRQNVHQNGVVQSGLMLEHIKSPDEERTRLSFAAEAGHLGTVIISLKVDPSHADLPDEQGRTPLSYAAAAGHERIVVVLQRLPQFFGDRYLVDVNLRDHNGHSAMWWAIQNGHESVAWLLKCWPGLCEEDKQLLRKEAPAWFLREKIMRYLQSTMHPGLGRGFSPSSATFRKGTPKFVTPISERQRTKQIPM